MKAINIEKINEKIYFEKLDNGLDVYLYPKTDIKNNYVTITTKFGSINNEFIPYNKKKMIKVPNGIAHFLEHKVFAQESGIDPSEFFSSSGTNYNAQTNLRFTSYEFSGPNNLEENIAFLLDFVQTPYFTNENVLSEKGIIKEEINMYKDSAIDVLYNKVKFNSLCKHPVRENIAGELSDIDNINKDVLYDCYYTFYNPNNMFLVITGNFNKDIILKKVKENQSKKKFNKNKEIINKEVKEEDKVYKEKEIINMNTDIPKVAYSIKIPIKKFKNYEKRKLILYLNLIFTILFDDTSSLNAKLKKENIITNNISIDILNCDSHILITLLNETKNYEKLEKMIDNELKNITISNDDFERKKKVYLSNEILIYNDIFAINDLIVDNVIFQNKIENKMFSIINSLNINELKEIIKNLDLSNKSIVIVEKK